MFKKLMYATVAFGLIAASPAFAGPAAKVSADDPTTGYNSADWLDMIGKVVNGSSLIGIDGVLMVNAYSTPLTVTCSKWTLVGPSPYIQGNPVALAPFSVTFVQTKGFDGYCVNGVTGHAGVRSVGARLDSSDGSFVNATIITFAPQ